MRKKNDTKQKIIDAFDQSKIVADACRIAGVSPSAFYFHYYKDADFKRRVLEKRREHLAEQIAATVI